MKFNYYELLDLKSTASMDEIRSAYRKMSKHYHPDLNKAPNASTMFRLISEAHDTLSDPSKRRLYDAELSNKTHAGPTDHGTYSNNTTSQTHEKKNPKTETNSTTSKKNNLNLITRKVLIFLRSLLLMLVVFILSLFYRALELLFDLAGGLTKFVGGIFVFFSILSLVLGYFNPEDMSIKNTIICFVMFLSLGGFLIYLSDEGYDSFLYRYKDLIEWIAKYSF